MKWRVAVDRALAPLGLTHAQYSLLGSLLSMERSGVRPSQRQLADYTGLEPLYVSKLARALEAAGLLSATGIPPTPGRSGCHSPPAGAASPAARSPSSSSSSTGCWHRWAAWTATGPSSSPVT